MTGIGVTHAHKTPRLQTRAEQLNGPPEASAEPELRDGRAATKHELHIQPAYPRRSHNLGCTQSADTCRASYSAVSLSYAANAHSSEFSQFVRAQQSFLLPRLDAVGLLNLDSPSIRPAAVRFWHVHSLNSCIYLDPVVHASWLPPNQKTMRTALHLMATPPRRSPTTFSSPALSRRRYMRRSQHLRPNHLPSR